MSLIRRLRLCSNWVLLRFMEFLILKVVIIFIAVFFFMLILLFFNFFLLIILFYFSDAKGEKQSAKEALKWFDKASCENHVKSLYYGGVIRVSGGIPPKFDFFFFFFF